MGRLAWLSRVFGGFVATAVVATAVVGAAAGPAAAAAPASPSSSAAAASTSATPSVPVAPASAFLHPAEELNGGGGGGGTGFSISVVLTADNTDITEGEVAHLTAYASTPLNGTGLAIYIYGFSEDWAIPRLMNDGPCTSGSSCTATVDWEANPADYQAFVAPDGLSFNDVLSESVAVSNRVTIPSSGGDGSGGPQPWSVSLIVSPTLLPRDHSVTVVAAANQSVAGTPYEVEIFALDDGSMANSCGSSNGCTFPVKWKPGTWTYQAFVMTPSSQIPSDPVAASEPVTVTSSDWTVQLFPVGKDHMTAEAVSNRPVGGDTSTVLMVYDTTTRQVLNTCASGRTCPAEVPNKGDAAIAFVTPTDASTPVGNYLARSGAVSFPDGQALTRNPAGLTDGRPCACDPIDPADGTLYESATDLSVPGRGPGLAVTRSYTSSAAGVASRFGYGWVDDYSMRLIPAPNDDGSLPASLASATNVQVVQENGTTASFARQADGSFAAPPNVLASLARNPDGTFTFTRMHQSVFVFNAYGFLTAEKDLHDNTTTVTYDADGRLSTVTDAAARTLSYSYSDDGMVAKVVGPGGRSETYGYDGNGNLVSAADETGATWRYGYDALHELTSVTNPDGDTTTNSFDALGRVVAQTDGRGMTTTFTYRDDGSTVITHPAGDVTTLTYRDGLLVQRTDGGGVDASTWQYQYDPVTFGLAQVVDPNQQVTTYTHDGAGNITSVTDATGATTSYSYDGLNDQTSIVDPLGQKTTRVFDTAGELLQETDPTGAIASYSYDGFGDPVSVTDPDRHTTSFGYDNAGNVTSSTDATGAKTTMTVDGVGETTAVTDPLGRTTSFGYDPRGLVTSVTNNDDETTSYGYDPAGRRTSMTDATGRTWTYTYDAAGNVVRTTNPDGSFVATGYDPDGRVATVADAAGNTSTDNYDNLGNLIKTTDPTGAVTTNTYDPALQLTSTTAPNGGITSFGYDADGRTTSVTDANGGVSHVVYDAAGRIVSNVDAAGNTTGYGYDADGRLTTTTRADGSVVRDSYDPAGLLLSTTDAADNLTAYRYDADGRRVSATDPDGRVTAYGYDAASQLVSTIDAMGRAATDSYDPAGRLVGVDYTDPNTADVAYSYDAAGRRVSMHDGTGTTTYSYDTAGHLVQVANPISGTVGYGYDGLGRVATVTYPDGRVVARSYDAAGRLASVNDGTGLVTRFAYDGDGNLVATTYPNGVVQQQTFNPADQMTATTVQSGSGNVLASFTYQVNALGLATSVTATGSASGPAPAAQAYRYDPLSQLTGVTTTAGSGTAGSPTGTFAYDKTGNVTGLPDGTTLSYDPASQLTGSVGPGAIPTSYGFDPAGDRTAQTTGGLTSTFGYDQASQLTSVNIPGRSPYHLMAAGEFFSLAVRGDGSVRAWGDNRYGQLGDARACGTDCPTETTVPGLPTMLQVAAGRNHALAVSTDGRVFAWGSNSHGQLGNNTTTDSSTPLQVPGLSDVVTVAAAGDSSYALTKDGHVYAWGENDQGQLGDGTTTDSHTPVLVQNLPRVADISAGALPDGPTHALAATADGHVYTWGAAGPNPADPIQAHDAKTTNPGNSNGQGNGTGQGNGDGNPGNGDGNPGNGNAGGSGNGNGNGNGGSGCKTDNGVGNGGVPGGGHDNGHAGNCTNGRGNGNSGHGALLVPTLVDGVDGVIQVAAGGASSYALTSTGAVFAWGDDHYGELGLGADQPQTVDQPTQIPGLPTVKMLAAGGAHALALSTSGQVFGWGDDNTGQLGEPGPTCVSSDDDDTVKICPSPQLINNVTASAITAGYVHTLIATVYEHVDGLGRDAEGELGDGYTHPATQVGPAGDRNGLDTPDGGIGGAKHDLTQVTGLGQVRPQAPVTASYRYDGDGLRATSTTTVDDTTTVVPTATSNTYTWDTLAAIPTLISDGTHDYLTGPNGHVIEQTDRLGQPSADGAVFLHADRLGSTRLLTNTSGQAVATYTYTPTGQRIQTDGLPLLPYAQGIPPQQTTTTVGFAGAYTDPGTGWLYLQHRYNDPTTDQFLTVDPLQAITATAYSYADDDPTNETDPTGQCGWVSNDPCWGGGVWRNIINSGPGGAALDAANWANDNLNPMKGPVDAFGNEIEDWRNGCVTFWGAVKEGTLGAVDADIQIALQYVGGKAGGWIAKKVAVVAKKVGGRALRKIASWLTRKAAGDGAGATGRGWGPGTPRIDQPFDSPTVRDVLRTKLGSIQRAPLPPGSPSWSEIQDMTLDQIRAAAKANEPGYKTILKLLQDKRFNK